MVPPHATMLTDASQAGGAIPLVGQNAVIRTCPAMVLILLMVSHW